MELAALKQYVLKVAQKAISTALGKEAVSLRLSYPSNSTFGDFAVEFSGIARQGVAEDALQDKMSKAEKAARKERVASQIAEAGTRLTEYFNLLPSDGIIRSVDVVGNYLNFWIERHVYFGAAIGPVLQEGHRFGACGIGEGQRVMVEYLSPNTNKPLHLGHLRNGALGIAIANILEAAGFFVVKSNLVNDRGTHICKSMLAWQRWGNGETPESAGLKGDHFVGRWYVRYSQEAENDPGLEKEAQEMLRKWEKGDPETVALWRKMNAWVYAGFGETYRAFGLDFDEFYYESDTYKLGRDIVEEGLGRGIFRRDPKGAAVFFLPEEFGRDKEGKPKMALVLRSDGTSVYMTQDIGTALKKASDFGLDRSIYVVGSEQVHHFQCLFAILKALGYSWADKCYHLSYGMVYLPEGKMKSREGKVVDADNLIEEVKEMVAGEIRKRSSDLRSEELDQRAHTIAVGAIKFFLLRFGALQSIHFDPKASVALDGCTGPYCQYAYVRASGILRSAGQPVGLEVFDPSLLGEEEEVALARRIMQLPEEIREAAESYNPSRLAAHVFAISQAFNQFYNRHQVLGVKKDDAGLCIARLALVQAAQIAIRNGLRLLGIETVEEM